MRSLQESHTQLNTNGAIWQRQTGALLDIPLREVIDRAHIPLPECV